MEDNEIEIPDEVSQVGNVIETDVEELLNDVFNNLSQLRSKTLDEVSKKKTGYTPKLDVIINQVGNFTQIKKSLRCEATVHLQKLYPKWLRVLETALSAVRKKVDAVFEDSTLCTEDFTDGPSTFEAPTQSKTAARLYPNIADLLDQEQLTTKRKGSRTSSPPSGSSIRKMRKNSRPGFKENDESQDTSEDEPTPRPTPSRSSNRYASRKSTGFNTSMKTEVIEEYSTGEETPTSTLERNRSSMKKVMENKNNRLNQLVWDWFTNEQLKNVPISKQMVQTKAKQIAKDIGYTNFKASFDWLESFKTLYHVSWTPTGLCGSPTLESKGIQEGFVEEEIEEEEEVPEPVSTRKRRTARVSVRKQPGAAKLLSSSKATRKSMVKNLTEPMDVETSYCREIPIIKSGRKNGSEISNPTLKSKQKSGKQVEITRSFWKPIMSMDSKDMLDQPAVYQIKVHQAKKPAYIGVCDNLYSQVLKCQKAQSKQKQLDQFLDRNRNDIEVMFFYCNSLADAKIQHKEEIGKFNEKFKRNPVFNI